MPEIGTTAPENPALRREVERMLRRRQQNIVLLWDSIASGRLLVAPRMKQQVRRMVREEAERQAEIDRVCPF